MRYSTIDYRSLVAAMAVLLIAFGAMGIALVDEADGADADDSTSADSGGASVEEGSEVKDSEKTDKSAQVDAYKVVYTYGDQTYNAITTDSTYTLLSYNEVFGAASAPVGYTSDGWRDADGKTVTTVTGAATVYAAFVPDSGHAEVVLTCGDVTKVYLGATSDVYTLAASDIEVFGDAIGIALTVDKDGSIASADRHYTLETTHALADLKADAGRSETYEFAVSDPIYTITAVVDGTAYDAGTSDAPNLPSPSKDGYRFVGWSLASNGEVIPEGYVYTADTTLYAVWEPAIWSVVLVSEGETVVTETVRNGDLAIRPATEPTKAGYTFAGWLKDGQVYDFASPVTSDLVLEASFAEIPATVTYIVDGITVHDPAEPSKYGYTFAGWNDGTTTIAPAELAAYIEALPAATSVTLTAVWTPIYYDVIFVAGEDRTVRSAAYGGQIDAPALPEGYKTWINADGFAVAFPYTVTADATITAVAYEVYTVTFAAGERTVDSVPVTEGRAVAELPELPEGYSSWAYDGAAIVADTTIQAVAIVYWTVTFDFGYTYINDGGFAYRTVQDGQVVTDIPEIPDILGDVRWTYKGEPITADTTVTLEAIPVYTVTFVAGESSVPVSVLEGQAAVAPGLPEGYASWDYDGSAIYADATVEAVPVEEPVYTVTYIIEGKAPVVQMSDSLVVPETAREGYEFQGWVVSGSSTYIDPLAYGYTADTTVIAVYKAVPVAPDEPGHENDRDSGVLAEVAVVIVVFVALAVIAVAVVRKGGFAAVKASAAEKRAAKKAKKTEKSAEGAQEAQKKS